MDVSIFHKLLVSAVQKGASDVHLQAGHAPLLRINGELMEVKYHPLSPEETASIAEEVLSHTYRRDQAATLTELDVSYGIEGQARFRVNIYRQRGTFAIILRVIPVVVKSLAELNLPPVIEQISNLRRGLVLVAGATGNGKSTTLAAMVELINQTRRAHILTIEDPIEFLFKNKMSAVSQREVGCDTPGFGQALKAALRQDPDVIMIGEMRDAETIEIAMKAAETGHLVLSSVHTLDSVSTIARLLGYYPGDEEPIARKRLAECLMAVISLRLLPTKNILGRVPAVEILRATRTIQECIKDASKTSDIPSHLQKGQEMYGMQTFDQHLVKLVKEGAVDLEVAKTAASNPSDLERAIMMEG